MDSLVKKSFRILTGRGVVAVFSILFTVYFAYELPKTIFALIALYDTVVSLSKILTDLGLHYKIIREVPPIFKTERRTEAITKIIMPCTWLRAGASLVVALLYPLIILVFYDPLQQEFPELNLIYIGLLTTGHLFIENLQTITTPLFFVKQRFGANAMLEAATTLVEKIIALALYLAGGINQYFLGLLLGQAFIFLLRMVYLKDIFLGYAWFAFSYNEVRNMLVVYFPFYLRKFFRMGFVQSEQILIAALLPLEQVANFKLAKQASSFLKTYIAAFYDPLSIQLSKTLDLSKREKHKRTYFLFTIPLPVLLTLLSPWIMQLVGGPKYADSWFILSIMYFSYIIACFSGYYFTVITIFGKPTEALYRDAAAGVVGFAATFILILLFSEYGIAWGQVVSYTVLAFTGYQIAKRYTGVFSPPLTEDNK